MLTTSIADSRLCGIEPGEDLSKPSVILGFRDGSNDCGEDASGGG